MSLSIWKDTLKFEGILKETLPFLTNFNNGNVFYIASRGTRFVYKVFLNCEMALTYIRMHIVCSLHYLGQCRLLILHCFVNIYFSLLISPFHSENSSQIWSPNDKMQTITILSCVMAVSLRYIEPFDGLTFYCISNCVTHYLHQSWLSLSIIPYCIVGFDDFLSGMRINQN